MRDRDWLTRWCPDASFCTASVTDRVEYDYDAVGNQTAVTGTGDVPDPGAITMTYDDADQRTSTGRSGGATPGSTNHQWDADGNLTDAGRQYDPLGRLATADASAGGTATYRYNAIGQRRTAGVGVGVGAGASAESTHWSWDINNTLPQLAESTRFGEPMATHDYTPDGWALSTTIAGAPAEQQWYSHDAQGSIIDSLTGTGELATQRAYDPWGDLVEDLKVDPGTTDPAFGYTSAAPDPGTGVWHLRARDYDPATRSFTAVDPANAPAEMPWMTTYHYGLNQPTYWVDPSGRCSIANGIRSLWHLSFTEPSPCDLEDQQTQNGGLEGAAQNLSNTVQWGLVDGATDAMLFRLGPDVNPFVDQNAAGYQAGHIIGTTWATALCLMLDSAAAGSLPSSAIARNWGNAATGGDDLLRALASSGVKHTPENIVGMARDASGRVVFLETGNSTAGLTHILQRHASDFARGLVLARRLGDVLSDRAEVYFFDGRTGQSHLV